MKISVILAFLLSWSFVSSNPLQETSNDKSVREINHENHGGSVSSNLARTESSDEASSGKDWGGDILNPLSQTDLDGTDKNDDADNKSYLPILIPKGSKRRFVHGKVGGITKMMEFPSNDEDLLVNSHNKNILPWIQENKRTFFTNQDREAEESVDEELGKYDDNRVKRNLEISNFLWGSPHTRSISEQLLKLSEGSTSNVLRSEKATVAEALNGRAAIRKILERAKANAAKVVPHKDLYNSNDFSKWLLSGSTFDTNIFHHPHHRLSPGAEIEGHSDTENADDSRHRTSSTLHNHVFDPMNRQRHYHHHNHRRHREGEHTFNTLSDSAAVDTADTEHLYAKLLHKSKHRQHLSPKSQITSEEKRTRDETDGIFRKSATVSHQASSYEDDTGLQYYSHVYAPYMRFRVTEDEDAENDMPKWKHTKWIHRFGARAPHSADSLEFDSSDEMDDYEKKYIFKSTFDGFGDKKTTDVEARAGDREGHGASSGMDIYDRINRDSLDDEDIKLTTFNSHGEINWKDVLARKQYYYGIGNQERFVYDDETGTGAFGGTKNRHLADLRVEHASSMDSHREENIRNKNKHLDQDAVELSAIYSMMSAETMGGAGKRRPGNMLTTKMSTPTQKSVDIDTEHYRTRDRNAAVNTAASLSSSLSDEKGSEHTNNALTLPSVDDRNDGSVAGRREVAKSAGHGVRQKIWPVIDNEATAAEIEMGFSGIKSHPKADLPRAHSSPSRERSKTHLGNQGAHRGISGHGRAVADAIASTETEHSMDSGEDVASERTEPQKNLPVGKYENADYALGKNKEINGNTESPAEATSSVGSEHSYDLLRTALLSDDSYGQEYAGISKEHVDRHGMSTEVIDFPDDNNGTYILMPEFPIYKFRKGHWPYDVNYYDFNNDQMHDDQDIEVGESTGNSREGEINYDGWEQEGKFSTNDKTSNKSMMAIFNGRKSKGQDSQHTKHGEYVQLNLYDHHAFKRFLRNMKRSSSIISNISEYEAWKKYIAYLYYLWKRQKDRKSDASFETSTLANAESKKQDNAIDEEMPLDRHGRKHTTDEDNYTHLRKHKKWSQRAGEFVIKNALDSKQDKIKLIKINNGKTSDEDYGERKMISKENVDNQKDNHEVHTRTTNVIREDSGTADIMSKARSNEKVIDNNNYHQQGSWNSLSSENSYVDARTKTHGYGSYRRNKKFDTNQAAKTTESADSKSNTRRISIKASSTPRSYAESQMNEHIVNKSNDVKKSVTQMQESDKEDEYQDKYQANSRDTSVTSFKWIDKSQMKRMHHLREKSKTDKKNSASTEILTETASSSNETNKSQYKNTAAIRLSTASQDGFEHYMENLEDDKKRNTNAGASANAIFMKDRQESILENTSSFSKSSAQSKTELENYSNKNTRNIQINTSSSKASTASSSKSFAKSKAKAKQMRNDSKNVQINANASSTAMFSNNVRKEWSKSSSKSSAESRLKSDYYLTNRKDAISRSSASSMLSDTIEDKSHLQKSFSSSSSTSSGKLQTKSQHDSNNVQNSQMNVAAAESSATSTSLSNNESKHWPDSSKSSASKSMEEAHQHNSNNVIKIQKSNIENRSELENASSSKSRVRSKLKDGHYLRVTKNNGNNVVKTGASSKTASSADVKDNQQESISLSSASYSSAESRVENKSNIKEASMSNIISSKVVNDMKQRNLSRVLLSSQTTSKGDLKVQEENPRTTSNSATVEMSTKTNDDKRKREDNTLKATWFITPKSNLKTSTNNEVIGKGENRKENSDAALNTATLATAISFTDIKNMQNSITTSSSSDSKAETKIYSKNQLNKSETITGNSIISRISATSGTSNEISDNDKNKLLKMSSLSESYSTSAEEKRRDMDTVQNSQESMAAVKVSSESTISSNKVRSQNESTEKSTTFSKETRQKQKNLNIRRGKSEDSVSEATSNNVNNIEYRDNVMRGTSSVISYKNLQINSTDKLRDKNKNEANVRDSVEMSESAIIQNNKHQRLKHVSSYDYRGGERAESEINSRSSIKYSKHKGDINEMISTGSVTSTTSSNANRNNLLKVISSDNLHAESLQEDEDKSDIHLGADETASTGITSYDDKQARGNILRKLILLSNPSDEAQMMYEGNYDIPKKLLTVNGNKEFNENNLRKMSNRLKVRNENVESAANTKENAKDATDLSTYQDDPNANVQDEHQLESTSSTDTKAQSGIDQKSSISKENKIINTETRDIYNINKWRTKYQTTASSSLHAETQENRFENMLQTTASTESIISKIDENSHKDDSTQGQSSSISSHFQNYNDQRTNLRNAAKSVKASAKTSIFNVPSIERQDDGKKEVFAISQLKRHDLNVRDGDKGIASDVLQSAEEAKLNRMQNTRQQQLSGSITSLSNSCTEVQHEGISNIGKEGLKVTASVTTSAQTTSSETVENCESGEKLIEVSSESNSYTKSQKGSKHSLNTISRQGQIIANAKASANSAVSNNLESVRQNDWVKKDSLVDPSRNTNAKIENKNIVESNLANIADATSSTKETNYSVIKDERQSGVTTTALLSNSCTEAQEQHDCNSSVQRESTETSSNDTKDRVVETENILNSKFDEANLKATVNTKTAADAISSSGVQDSSRTSSSANLYAESQMDNTHAQAMASNEFSNMEVGKSRQMTSSSDAYSNARATGENTNNVGKDSSAVVNAKIETATSTDIKGSDLHGRLDVLNAARNSQGTMNTETSATSLVSASVDAQERHTDNFMREKSNVSSQIQGMTRTENDDNVLQKDLHNSGNVEVSEQITHFSDVKSELKRKEEHESRTLQKQRLITVNSTASSISKTFDRTNSMQKNNIKELATASSSNSYGKLKVESKNHVSVLAKDHMDVLGASTSAQTMASNEFRNTKGDKSLQRTSSSDIYVNAQAISENINGAGKYLNAVNTKTETATSSDIKSTEHSLFDLLTGTATRMRTKSEAISREGAIKEDLSGTSSDVFSGAGVGNASAKILSGNYKNSAAVDAIAETGSGDQYDQQGDSRGTASSSSGIRHSQLGIMKLTSSANSYAAAQTTSGGMVEENPGVNISTLGAAEAHNQVKGAHPSGWLLTTSDADTVAEGRVQNKDKFNVLREVEEVAVYAGAADASNVEGEQRDARVEEAGEYQSGLNISTKIRHAAAASSSASAVTIMSMEMENKSESNSVLNNKMTSSFNGANAETRIRTEGKSSVLRNAEISNTEEMRNSTTSSASTSTLDNLNMNHRAKYHQTGNGMWAILPASKGTRLSSGETRVLYPSREISKCDENVETREFISEATSLYQMLNKQQGSEILLMKKNPKGPVQIASLKNSVPPLIAYRLIPREVYERIRAIITHKQIFCADCAVSST